ncbi:MAG TPA: phosphate-starvation-inducible PsiE family protein [Lichenihabitans sp.]|jgi:uncharacterized membrane protein (DUF373 family)|nr:phosphate-starvation-inducible PsiE family protein [Lichenihabitans sp.]
MAETSGGPSPHPAPKTRWSAEAIHSVEQWVYIIIGVMLVLALLLALAGAAKLLWGGLGDWSGAETTVQIMDRLLFVLMLVEILHTVHASIRTGTLMCEPFLIVGLIACIRRVLVITLQTSQITQPDKWNPANTALFHAAMLELGVLALLITVLVVAIRLTRPLERPAGTVGHVDGQPG